MSGWRMVRTAGPWIAAPDSGVEDMTSKAIKYGDVKKGLVVRRGGNPKTPQGRARKGETFTVTDVYGKPGNGYSRAKLEGHGRAFWVYPVHLVDKWEKA